MAQIAAMVAKDSSDAVFEKAICTHVDSRKIVLLIKTSVTSVDTVAWRNASEQEWKKKVRLVYYKF